MKTIIEPEFKINDLVQHKFTKNSDVKKKEKSGAIEAYEVLFIHTETCSAGTQIFYYCRALSRIYFKDGYGDNAKVELINVAIGQMDNGIGTKFREDELVMCDPEVEQIIRS